MSSRHWVLVAAIGTPVLIGATVVSATLGPAGAIAYASLLTAGIHTPRLFHLRTMKGRHR